MTKWPPGIRPYQFHLLSRSCNMPGSFSSNFKGKSRLEQITCLTKTTQVCGCWISARWPLCQVPGTHPLDNQPSWGSGRGKHCCCSERLWVDKVFKWGHGEDRQWSKSCQECCFLEYPFPTHLLRTLLLLILWNPERVTPLFPISLISLRTLSRNNYTLLCAVTLSWAHIYNCT